MCGDEVVVVQMWVTSMNPVDLFTLAGAERFVWVQTPNPFEQTLTMQHFVQTGDATGVAIGGVEEGSVAIGNFNSGSEQVGGDWLIGRRNLPALAEKFHRPLCPHRPVSQEPANNAAFRRLSSDDKSMGCEEVQQDVVVVAGVERDVASTGVGDRSDDIERLVAVERGDLDGDDVFDFREPSPERVGQNASTGRGLEIEAEQRDDLGDVPAMG